MRIFANKEIKTQDNFIANISKYKLPSDKNNKSKEQVSSLVLESTSEENADFVEISEDARSLYEEMERLKENAEASEDAMDELGKILTIARRISKGDKVPSTDEKKLMEYNPDLYQAAKTAALLKANRKQKEHDSLFEDEEGKREKINGEDATTLDVDYSNQNSDIETVEVDLLM